MRTETDSRSVYLQACAHDRLGEEAEAMPLYEHALALGLEGGDRRGAMIGLGSSLRNVGRAADGVEVLARAADENPGDAAVEAFLALALLSAGRSVDAVRTLLGSVLRHAPVGEYARSLGAYRAALLESESSTEGGGDRPPA